MFSENSFYPRAEKVEKIDIPDWGKRTIDSAREMVESKIRGMESLSDETKESMLAGIYKKLEDSKYIGKILPIWQEELKKCENPEETEGELARGLGIRLLDEFMDKNKAA